MYHELCELAISSVDFIVLLSARAQSLAQDFAKIYATFDWMQQGTRLLSNATGNNEWQETQIHTNPTTCRCLNAEMHINKA
jgi:hypothetical protein